MDDAATSSCTFQLSPTSRYFAYTALFSAIAWCFVVVLAVKSFMAKFRDNEAQMRRFLLVYVLLMTLGSTGSLIQTLVVSHEQLFSPFTVICGTDTLPTKIYGTQVDGHDTAAGVLIPLLIFGADSLMLWRCWVLYFDTMGFRRFCIRFLLVSLLLISIASVITSIFYGWPMSAFGLLPGTVGINIILSGLIAGRLFYHERCMKRMIGIQRESPFKKIIHICVESSAMISICGTCALVLAVAAIGEEHNASLVPSIVLGQVSVISSFLIIVRVACGRNTRPADSNVTAPMEFKTATHQQESSFDIDLTLSPITQSPRIESTSNTDTSITMQSR